MAALALVVARVARVGCFAVFTARAGLVAVFVERPGFLVGSRFAAPRVGTLAGAFPLRDLPFVFATEPP